MNGCGMNVGNVDCDDVNAGNKEEEVVVKQPMLLLAMVIRMMTSYL